jgi:hypothetical protein
MPFNTLKNEYFYAQLFEENEKFKLFIKRLRGRLAAPMPFCRLFLKRLINLLHSIDIFIPAQKMKWSYMALLNYHCSTKLTSNDQGRS